jgi:methyl acetate hydrolase
MTKPVTSVMMPGGVDEFGLGFAMNTRALAKGRGAGTLSWSGVFDTFFWIDRENQTCAVLLTQVLPFLDDAPRVLLEEFERAVYSGRD